MKILLSISEGLFPQLLEDSSFSFRKFLASASQKFHTQFPEDSFFRFWKILFSASGRFFPQLMEDSFLSFQKIQSSASGNSFLSSRKMISYASYFRSFNDSFLSFLKDSFLQLWKDSFISFRKIISSASERFFPSFPEDPFLSFKLTEDIGKFHLHKGKCSLFQP